MSLQIRPSVTNPTTAEIYENIQSGRLVLRPDFQRKFVWTHEHQENFIDTILSGLPFPEIYICEGDIDIKRLKTTRHVIDGQQRLTTIKNYIEGNNNKPFNKISTYEQLSDSKKEKFLSYQIVVRDIGKVDEETVREIFRRINLTKFKLEDVEVHNAIYDGKFIQAAKTILDNVELEQYGVFRESEFTRMADLHFILLVMSTIENGGYFAQDREVESNIVKFNDEYPRKDHMIALMLKTFAIISDLDLESDSIWFRKSNFFTLVVEISMHQKELPNIDIFKEKLTILESNILKNKNNSQSPYSKYYSYMYQATHGRTARITRSEFLLSEVFCVKKTDIK
ncbi:MAG: DUF262 domain-containing protein [Snowella sp.]|nr:DUF262 domain-containing protein [Snowella sp.]